MRIFQVDAFTDSAFAGNPAAVCLLDGPADPRWMQRLAAEMNLAETAFVEPRDGGYLLRWFTPVVEVALCGHATLASAHVLFETRLAAAGEPVTFESASGPLTARLDDGPSAGGFPRGRRHRGRGPRHPARPGQAASGRHPGHDRDRAGEPAGCRFRLSFLRPGGRHPGGSGHRLGALHAGPVLVRAARPDRADWLPGI